jgi:large subunit ribosomal protein L17
MRHRRRVKHFSRKSGPRKALLRGLVINLVEHGRISTTVEKAKELRRHIEKAVTLGKKNDLATRRLLLSRIPHEATVSSILDNISPRFLSRPGGYTRVIKIGRRPGDTAEMAFIEFVDFDFSKASAVDEVVSKKIVGKGKSKDADSSDVSKSKAKTPVSKIVKTARLAAAKKKAVMKIQKRSRQEARS